MSDAKKPAPRKAQRGLGRGLSALIGDAAAPKVAVNPPVGSSPAPQGDADKAASASDNAGKAAGRTIGSVSGQGIGQAVDAPLIIRQLNLDAEQIHARRHQMEARHGGFTNRLGQCRIAQQHIKAGHRPGR